jgi:hypothetical protein
MRKDETGDIVKKECKHLDEQPTTKKQKILSFSQREDDGNNSLKDDGKIVQQFSPKISPSPNYNGLPKDVLNQSGQETSSKASPSFSDKVKKKLAKFCFKQYDEENVHRIDNNTSTQQTQQLQQNQPNNSIASVEQSLVSSEHFPKELPMQKHPNQQEQEQNQEQLKVQQQNKEKQSFSFQLNPNESRLHPNEILPLSTTYDDNVNKSQFNSKALNPSTNNNESESLHSIQTTFQIDLDDVLSDLDIPLDISSEFDNFFHDEKAPQVPSTSNKTLLPPTPEIGVLPSAFFIMISERIFSVTNVQFKFE